MLTIYHSNRLDALKTMLVTLQQVQPLADPFAREQILVQSPGMAQWLKLELAQAFGIAANVAFPLPASFIWEMFTRVLPDMPSVSPFNKGAMSWQLMVLLPGLLSRPAFAPLASYLSPNGEAPEQVRQAQQREPVRRPWALPERHRSQGRRWQASRRHHASTVRWSRSSRSGCRGHCASCRN